MEDFMREKYETLALAQLKEIAKVRGLKGTSTMKKAEIIDLMVAEDERLKKEEEKKEEEKKAEAPAQAASAPAAAQPGNVGTSHNFCTCENISPERGI